MFRKAVVFGGELFKALSAHAALTQAAAIAFYTALSFAPLVLLLISIGALIGEDTKYELLGQFSHELGPRSADLAQGVVKAAANSTTGEVSWWRTAIGSAGLLIAASAVFGQLQSALNSVWAVVAKPSGLQPRHSRLWTVSITAWAWLRKRLLSMGMVLVVLLILLVSLVISAALAKIMPTGDDNKLVAQALDLSASFVVAALLFAAIFKVLPDAPIRWRDAGLGAAITSALFNAGKLVLSLYIDKAGVGKSYGEAVGGLIALLVWVYYSSVALLLGAEVTRMLAPPGPTAPGTALRDRLRLSGNKARDGTSPTVPRQSRQ